MRGAQCGPGFDPQFAGQPFGELAVGRARRGGAAVARQPVQLGLQRGFVQRVLFEQARGQRQRRRGRFGARQLTQRGGAPGGAQALAFEGQPAGPAFVAAATVVT